MFDWFNDLSPVGKLITVFIAIAIVYICLKIIPLVTFIVFKIIIWGVIFALVCFVIGWFLNKWKE